MSQRATRTAAEIFGLAVTGALLFGCGSSGGGGNGGTSGAGNDCDASSPCATTIIGGLDGVTGIVVDGTNIYYAVWPATGGAIYSVPLGGGSPSQLAKASGPALMATDGTNIYWAEAGGEDVMSVPISGGTPTTVAQSQTSSAYYGVAVQDGVLYWTSPSEGNVYEKLLASTSPNGFAIASSQAGCTGVTFTPGALFFSVTTGVEKMTLPDETPRSIFSDSKRAYGVATDGVNVYWADQTAGTVSRVPVSGGATTVVVSGESRPTGVALDSTYVYWTSNGDGAIRKLAK
jgi:hypothetical protein